MIALDIWRFMDITWNEKPPKKVSEPSSVSKRQELSQLETHEWLFSKKLLGLSVTVCTRQTAHRYSTLKKPYLNQHCFLDK